MPRRSGSRKARTSRKGSRSRARTSRRSSRKTTSRRRVARRGSRKSSRKTVSRRNTSRRRTQRGGEIPSIDEELKKILVNTVENEYNRIQGSYINNIRISKDIMERKKSFYEEINKSKIENENHKNDKKIVENKMNVLKKINKHYNKINQIKIWKMIQKEQY